MLSAAVISPGGQLHDVTLIINRIVLTLQEYLITINVLGKLTNFN